uniref:Reverse transcriptase domain-containing protein n=1 Tax=Tanacetum cinerariifolium TaxID=118510 RepID=A0A699GYA0_TANCI|nr:reverse transcriptase domain-containing protein [Tanacetum cinerariifolium]
MENTDNTNRNPEQAPVARKCSYNEFISCQPINIKGSEGVVGLIAEALSWWNSFAQPIGIEEAYKLSWVEFKKLLIKKYCPRTEVQKMEDEFFHLTVKGNDLKTYVRRFQELATLCPTMVSNSEKMIEDFVGGLPQSIEGNIIASKPQTLKKAINIAQSQEDQEEAISLEVVFKLANVEAPPSLSATTITAGPPAEGTKLSRKALKNINYAIADTTEWLSNYKAATVDEVEAKENLECPVYMRWIDYWRRRHSDKDEMKGIQDAIATKTIPPNTDREILDEVLKSTNRAHTVGVVRLLVGTGNSDSGRSQPNTSYCTQEQLEDLKRQHAFFISTPGGPSSTYPAPISTPLGLGNCYTPTFDAETSQSGEQDDNGSDDGNREYDVDIYDDE